MTDEIPWFLLGLGISFLIGAVVYSEMRNLTKCSRITSAVTAFAMATPLLNLIILFVYLRLCAEHQWWHRKREFRLVHFILGVIILCVALFGMFRRLDEVKKWLTSETHISVQERMKVRTYGLGGAHSIEREWVQKEYTVIPIVGFFAGYNLGFLLLALGLNVGGTLIGSNGSDDNSTSTGEKSPNKADAGDGL
jgi:hypothetical protein